MAKFSLKKLLNTSQKGGSMAKEEVKATSTTLWIGATVVFALLFFLSSVLDMKVNVTFGQGNKATNTTGSTNFQTVPQSTDGIASQVGGC